MIGSQSGEAVIMAHGGLISLSEEFDAWQQDTSR